MYRLALFHIVFSLLELRVKTLQVFVPLQLVEILLRLANLQFDCLVAAFLPDVSAQFDAFNLSADFYATQWFLTLFTLVTFSVIKVTR